MTNFQANQISSLLEKLRKSGQKIAVAESCTGGMLAAALTSISGASDVFDRGFITYSNEAKTEMLGVPAELIAAHGAVSAEVAGSMAHGAAANSKANVAVSITGIAGPNGGSAEKPVGLVYIGVFAGGKVRVTKNNISGNRDEVRREAVSRALGMLSNLF